MQGMRLVKKISIYFIGMLSSKMLSVLLIPIYAFYVKTEDLGYYDYMQSVMGVLLPFVYMAIWEAILRFVLSEKAEIDKKTATVTAAFFSFMMTCLLVIAVILYGSVITQTKNITLIALMFSSYGIANIWQYYARAFEENKTYVIAGVIGTVTNFILVIILICIAKLGLKGLLISYIMGQVSVFIFIEIKLRVVQGIKGKYIKLSMLKKMLSFSAPLVLNLSSIWLMSTFGRVIIVNRLGTEANGLFTFASKFSLIITLIGSVITMAIIEEAIISAKTKGIGSDFARTIQTLFKVFLSIGLVTVPVVVIFYEIIKKTDYYKSLEFAPWLLLYAVVTTMASNVGSVFQAISKTKYQFITTVLGGLVTVGLAVTLITFIGIYAVIIGQIIGAVTMLLSRYILINRFVDFKIKWRPVIAMSILCIGTILICLYTPFYISLIDFLLITVFIIHQNRGLLKVGHELVKSKLGK